MLQSLVKHSQVGNGLDLAPNLVIQALAVVTSHSKIEYVSTHFHGETNSIGAVLDNSELGYHGDHEKVTDKSG